MLLIRGEPGSGKTTLALQIAVNVLRNDQRLAISYCSLEEPTGWLPRRMPVPPVGDFRHASRQQFEEALKAWCDAKEAPRKMAKRVARTVKDVVPENLAVPVLTYVFHALFGNTALMATFLELVWNCGGKLEVNARTLDRRVVLPYEHRAVCDLPGRGTAV